MKRPLITPLLLMLLMFAAPSWMTAQFSTPLLQDDFSNPGLWTAMGAYNSSNGAPGTLTINAGVVEWAQFRGRQTFRLNRPLNGALTNQNRWRMELEFNLSTTQNLVGAYLMAMTENDLHPQSNASGSTTNNQNDGITLLVANPLSTSSPGNDHIRIWYKMGTAFSASSPEIQIQRNVNYFVRLERLNQQDLSLSVYSNAQRTLHIPGSPVCLKMEPGLRDLNYLQMSGGTTSSPSRINTIVTDNLALYKDVYNLSCVTNEGCDITADLQYTTDGGCFFQFYNNSQAGPGNTLFSYSIIDFGDGNTAQVAPGDIVSHTYANGGGYQVCITTKGHDAMLECCEDRKCIEIEANCEGDWEVRGKKAHVVPVPEIEIYPNPNSGYVQVRGEQNIEQLDVFNVNGQRVFSQGHRGKELELNLTSLKPGIYFLEASFDGNVRVRKKVVIQ